MCSLRGRVDKKPAAPLDTKNWDMFSPITNKEVIYDGNSAKPPLYVLTVLLDVGTNTNQQIIYLQLRACMQTMERPVDDDLRIQMGDEQGGQVV